MTLEIPYKSKISTIQYIRRQTMIELIALLQLILDARDTERTHLFGGIDSAGEAQCSSECWCIKGEEE
tara:strand:- start:183 stop:386 length:204 start_codon:yes stop_codon:yes gene_type:complete